MTKESKFRVNAIATIGLAERSAVQEVPNSKNVQSVNRYTRLIFRILKFSFADFFPQLGGVLQPGASGLLPF